MLSERRASLSSCDQMTDYRDNKYGVPNSDGTELYIVDSLLGCCSVDTYGSVIQCNWQNLHTVVSTVVFSIICC